MKISIKSLFTFFTATTLCQITLSNVPVHAASTLPTIEQVQALQQFLLRKITVLPSDIDYDWNHDDCYTVTDLCRMKQALLSTNTGTVFSVSNSTELQQALYTVAAGDTILLQPGTYESSEYGTKAALFSSSQAGTADQPITIKSADPEQPAILKGTDNSKGIVLYLTGDYWNIEGIVCSNAQKGIVLDHSNYTYLKNVEVYETGQEGIHLRDGSSYCVIDGANVHDTGLTNATYGEGIYIGSAKTTTGYAYNCDDNVVKNCTLGPNTTAECVDIKEYTTGNRIENCTLYGGGMTETDSFIDIKGNETTVQNNICDSQGNTTITDAFQVHCQVEGWGCDNMISNNTVSFTGTTEYIVRCWSGTSCTVQKNLRIPESENAMYRAYNGSTMTILGDSQ